MSISCCSCSNNNNISSNNYYCHPILKSPICINCLQNVRVKKINSCIWCGIIKDSDSNSIPEYVNCSLCSSKYCIYCLARNLGEVEMGRIAFHKPEEWKCFICDSESLEKLAKIKNWKKFKPINRLSRKGRRSIVSEDITLGRENLPIPCINEYDDTKPQSFTYVCQPIPGNTSALKKNPNFISCCTCTDNCRDPTRCECALLMGGFMYDNDGILIREPASGIYECNSLCSCHYNRCKNRVVGKGLQQKLQVFKCQSKGKGWGVRTLTDLPAGTYITSYIGEILHESDCETRGIKHGDEYLFELDAWARSRGCQRLEQLGLKWEQQSRHQVLINISSNLISNSSPSSFYTSLSNLTSISTLSSLSSSSSSSSSLCLNNTNTSSITISNGRNNEENLFHSLYPGLCDVASMTQTEIISIIGQSLFDKICQSNAILKSENHLILCGGKKVDEEVELIDNNNLNNHHSNNNNNNHNINNNSTTTTTTIITTSLNSVLNQSKPPLKKKKKSEKVTIINSQGKKRKIEKDEFIEEFQSYLPSQQQFKKRWLEVWQEARSTIVDRVQSETETKDNMFTIDAKWYGNVGRFLNHSCDPNLEKVNVFLDIHDVRLPRVAFFTCCHVKAGTELCYDYGYASGNVEGKHRECLCGSSNCRKQMY